LAGTRSAEFSPDIQHGTKGRDGMDSILLFYGRPISGSGIPNQPGVAVTGRLDAAGNLGTHTGFDFWSDVVAADTTSGRVLFYQSPLKTVGRLEPTGATPM
jgi:hypothetical protein